MFWLGIPAPICAFIVISNSAYGCDIYLTDVSPDRLELRALHGSTGAPRTLAQELRGHLREEDSSSKTSDERRRSAKSGVSSRVSNRQLLESATDDYYIVLTLTVFKVSLSHDKGCFTVMMWRIFNELRIKKQNNHQENIN